MPACLAGGVSQHALQVSGGGVSRPTPRGGGCIPACTEADPKPDGYCCGQYASYWNAFLLPFVSGIQCKFST